VDDIESTLRRITASVPVMDAEERKRLGEHLRAAGIHFSKLLDTLEKGAQ
jgi:hypothetical protein